MVKVIGNPIGWGLQALVGGAQATGEAVGKIGSHDMVRPGVNRITMAHVGRALRLGLDDFMAMRSDVVFLALIYPVVGILLTAFAYQASLVHLVFPLAAGFTLIGPLAAIGLYEMSKRRAEGQPAGIADAFKAVRRDTLLPIVALGAYLFVIFAVWIYLADRLHAATLGQTLPDSLRGFIAQVLTTDAGWQMMIFGSLIGFALAVLVLATSLVSFQMLVDRPVGLPAAVITSLRVVQRNPATTAGWGLIVVALLVIGALPALVGLIVVFPVLGHASWHLYRAAVSYH
jgi:uncharacterized membrane protein